MPEEFEKFVSEVFLPFTGLRLFFIVDQENSFRNFDTVKVGRKRKFDELEYDDTKRIFKETILARFDERTNIYGKKYHYSSLLLLVTSKNYIHMIHEVNRVTGFSIDPILAILSEMKCLLEYAESELHGNDKRYDFVFLSFEKILALLVEHETTLMQPDYLWRQIQESKERIM